MQNFSTTWYVILVALVRRRSLTRYVRMTIGPPKSIRFVVAIILGLHCLGCAVRLLDWDLGVLVVVLKLLTKHLDLFCDLVRRCLDRETCAVISLGPQDPLALHPLPSGHEFDLAVRECVADMQNAVPAQ